MAIESITLGKNTNLPGASKPHWSTYARGKRKVRGVMNKTEEEFFADHISPRRIAGEIVETWYEIWSWRLTEKTPDGKPGIRYTPDFVVMLKGGQLVAYEVKGTGIATRADLNRVKLAAHTIPIQFFVATKQTKKQGGGFKIEEY